MPWAKLEFIFTQTMAGTELDQGKAVLALGLVAAAVAVIRAIGGRSLLTSGLQIGLASGALGCAVYVLYQFMNCGDFQALCSNLIGNGLYISVFSGAVLVGLSAVEIGFDLAEIRRTFEDEDEAHQKGLLAALAALVVAVIAILGAAVLPSELRDNRGDQDDAAAISQASEGGSNGPARGPLDGSSPRVGELAPDFELADGDGNVVRLSDYRGRAVWLNFWATWCGPCRRELPDIELLASEFGEESLVVLAINQEESVSKAEGFWKELGLTLPIVFDSDGEVSAQYRLVGLPNNFFIDSDGVLRSFQLGFLVEEQMRESLAAAGVTKPGGVPSP